MLDMNKTDEVKNFIFKILVENQELKEKSITDQESVDMWFDLYKTAQNRVENLEKRIAELQAQPKEEQKDDLFACPAE